MQKQLDFFKSQVTLLTIKTQHDIDPLPLDAQPKYEKFPPSPDFMMTDDQCLVAQKMESKYTGSSVFGNKVYGVQPKEMDDSSEQSVLSKDKLLQFDQPGFDDQF
ncbi:hypothetical protein RP20_CCG021564 [Aedes albopictus]|nr:hypothetical protein RP20_CCG021564 [Aedes albopictus]